MSTEALKLTLANFFEGARKIQNRTHDAYDDSDWERWLRDLFPSYVTAPFAERHRIHWEWAWELKPGVRPLPLIEIFGRGGAKSTSVELLCPAIGARKTRKYAVYVCGAQDQADDHLKTVESMLGLPEVKHHYPDLAQRELNSYGDPKAWRRNRLWTARGLIVDALGLESKSIRGLKAEQQRPDIIFMDDIDARHDSPDTVAKKKQMIKDTLLPAGSNDCAVNGVQNLIHKNSIFSALQENGGADFLLDRIVNGPHRAIEDWPEKPVRGVDYEIRGIKYFILRGKPSWEGQNIETCQNQINTWGFGSFMREAQHAVDVAESGSLFPMFDEKIHVISWSEFADFYKSYDPDGNPMIPLRGDVTWSQDWGTTHQHPCMTGFGWRPAQEMRLNECFFIVGELGFPSTIYNQAAVANWMRANIEAGSREDVEAVAPTPVGMAIDDWLREHHIAVGRIKNAVMSHEASAACNTYRSLSKTAPGYRDLKVSKWNAKAQGGVEEIQDYLLVRDKLPSGVPFRHPFRPWIIGCPRLFLVVQDEQVDKANMVDSRGLKRLRQEIPEYKNPTSPGGIEGLKPKKGLFDDAVDWLRMMADVHWPRSQRKTQEQEEDDEMPPEFKSETINSLPPLEREQAKSDSYFARFEARAKVKSKHPAIQSARQSILQKYKPRR